MENFIYDIGTKIYFGKNQISNLSNILSSYGKRIMLVYGGGSIKKNGIYDEIKKQLDQHYTFVELSGVEANPRIGTVKKGIKIAREFNVDVLLAVGGGSVIDCAKLVASGFFYSQDPWDLVKNPQLITKALPIISILTIAATGSEMDYISVISNPETNEKIGTRHPSMRPKVSILDPTYTFTVSKYQSAAGVADILSHAMESYFSNIKGYFQDRVAEAVMKTVIYYGPKVLENPEDYEARANIMWASSWAINDFLKLGKYVAWSVHPIEHQLSAVYDITHGVGLAILTPHWLEKILNKETSEKIAQWATNVFGVSKQANDEETAKLGIEKLKNFYREMGLPESLKELNIDSKHFKEMAAKSAPQVKEGYVSLSERDIEEIYQESL